jgi:hypothetical protein
MCATLAGGRPITAPETAPKMIMKARVLESVDEVVQTARQRIDERNVVRVWTGRAPKLSQRY